jgi:hypothetical protein
VQNPYNSIIIYDFIQGYLPSEVQDDIQEKQIQNNILITQLVFSLPTPYLMGTGGSHSGKGAGT